MIVRDKQQSIYQGRPSRLRYCDSSVAICFLDEYDELQPFDTFTYSLDPSQLDTPTRSVTCLEQLCKLSIIAESILIHLYSELSRTDSAAELLRISGSLQAELDEWQDSLPPHLSLDSDHSKDFDILPHSLSLM